MIRSSTNTLFFLFIGGLLSFSTVDKSYSQSVMGARAVALGQASTALPNTEWSVFANPAMMSTDRRTISFFGIRYYGFSEITDMAASVNYPFKYGAIGAGAHRYGFDLFSKNRVRVTYKNAFQNFHYGATLNYSHVSQGGGYGSAGAIGVDLGIAASLFEGAWIAAKATNINQPEYGNIDEVLPRELAVGFSYLLSEVALVTSEVVKDVRFPISYRGGVEIPIFENFYGRAGITTEPTTFSGGFGYAGGMWKINVAAQNHIELGISPGLDLSIEW